jgi:hypothetical protein
MQLTLQLIQELAQTSFCRPAVASLAGRFEDTPITTLNTWVEQLTEQGEDIALNRLLDACSFAAIQLDPTILARSAGVIQDITHLPFCYIHQGADAIEPLIKMARSKELSNERQALLGRLAAELALRHRTLQDKVNVVLEYLLEELPGPMEAVLISDSIHLLESGKLKAVAFPILINIDIHAALPDRPPPKVIGAGETVRRPIPKLGRNERCHCGSGKKYKRCCYEKDQAILSDASSYEGVTQTQLMENPGLVDDARVIHNLRAYEIKKLNPADLTVNQLMPAYRKACTYGLLDVAFAMVSEYAARPDLRYPFDPGHYADLLHLALAQGDMELAQQIRPLIPTDLEWVNPEEIDFQFELRANPGHLETIEERCKEAFCALPDEQSGLRPHRFCDLAHLLLEPFPALSILVARAALQECPDRTFDNEFLIENVHQARVELGLSPWDDPIDTWAAEYEQTREEQVRNSEQARETESLRKQLAASREKIRRSEIGLREKEARLAELKNELETTAATTPPPSSSTALQSADPDLQPADSDTIKRLRRQIGNLKAEIGNQQQQRHQLRRELDRERRQAQLTEPTRNTANERADDEKDPLLQCPDEAAQTLLIPEYHSNFRNACGQAPGATAAGAMKAITAFALYDPAVWRNARGIRQLPNIYRVRIGHSYRLLLSWIPGKSLTALDLIQRQDLESWIRRHR